MEVLGNSGGDWGTGQCLGSVGTKHESERTCIVKSMNNSAAIWTIEHWAPPELANNEGCFDSATLSDGPLYPIGGQGQGRIIMIVLSVVKDGDT